MTIPDLPNTYRAWFLFEIVPEEGDTLESLSELARETVADWLPDGFVFHVEPFTDQEATR